MIPTINKNIFVSDIKNGPYKSLNANRYLVVSDVILKQANKFLPRDITKLGQASALYVHPEYRGYVCFLIAIIIQVHNKVKYYSEGIATLLYAQVKELLKKSGCDTWLTCAVVDGTKKAVMHPDIGMKMLCEFPYSKFKEQGIAIFDDLEDGTTENTILYNRL